MRDIANLVLSALMFNESVVTEAYTVGSYHLDDDARGLVVRVRNMTIIAPIGIIAETGELILEAS